MGKAEIVIIAEEERLIMRGLECGYWLERMDLRCVQKRE